MLAGDDLLAGANGRWTHGITIHGRPGDVWPWLAQMGCRRAGWYSYDGLDNGGAPSAQRILPEFQHVAVGDIFPWTPTTSDGFILQALDAPHWLVLGGDARARYRVTWAFVLEPVDAGTTRLLTRVSGEYHSFVVGIMLRLVSRPIHFAMQRKQLLNIRCRVEATGM